MAVINNPFIVGGYISPHYFCDREVETEQLIRNITNGRNVVIISVRRMGGEKKSQTNREKLQKRIAKAQQQGRYNKVKALEYLLRNSERKSLTENK